MRDLAGGVSQAPAARPRTDPASSCRVTAGSWTPRNACRCRRRIGAAIQRERVDPDNLLFARRVSALKLEMERFTDAGAIFRSHPELRTPPELVDAVMRAVS